MSILNYCRYTVVAMFALAFSMALTAHGANPPAPVQEELMDTQCPGKDEGESITVDADGNYVFKYEGCTVVYEPPTKIDPTVVGHLTFNPKTDTVSYDYQLHNSPKSKQAIAGMRLDGTNASFNERMPTDWRGGPGSHHTPGRGHGIGFYRWPGPDGERGKGLAPGATLTGIGFDNTDLPGVGNVHISGAITRENNFEHGSPHFRPGVSDKTRNAINEITMTNHVERLAPIPMIPVASPFNAAAVLTAIQQHLNKDLTELGLVQPALAGRLDSLFQKAINSAKGNNVAGVRDTIRELKTQIERAQGGKVKTIDPLAVQVLVFDLKVVDQRLGN